jgi:hypothetical protein
LDIKEEEEDDDDDDDDESNLAITIKKNYNTK